MEDRSALTVSLLLSVSVSVVPDKDIDELVTDDPPTIEDKSAVTLLFSVSVNVSILPDKSIEALVVLSSISKTDASVSNSAHDNPPFPFVVNT